MLIKELLDNSDVRNCNLISGKGHVDIGNVIDYGHYAVDGYKKEAPYEGLPLSVR